MKSLKSLNRKKIDEGQEQWDFAQKNIKQVASVYTMPGVSWNLQEVQSLSIDFDKEMIIAINLIKTSSWSKSLGSMVSNSKPIPAKCWNLWIIERDKSHGEHNILNYVTKLYSTEGVWEGAFTSLGQARERRERYLEFIFPEAASLRLSNYSSSEKTLAMSISSICSDNQEPQTLESIQEVAKKKELEDKVVAQQKLYQSLEQQKITTDTLLERLVETSISQKNTADREEEKSLQIEVNSLKEQLNQAREKECQLKGQIVAYREGALSPKITYTGTHAGWTNSQSNLGAVGDQCQGRIEYSYQTEQLEYLKEN